MKTENMTAATTEEATLVFDLGAHNCEDVPAPPWLEWYKAYQCQECDQISAEAGGALYECSDDGTNFNRLSSADGCSHRCPSRNKFSAKIADDSCDECDGAEADIVWVYDCPTCANLVVAPDQEETDRA